MPWGGFKNRLNQAPLRPAELGDRRPTFGAAEHSGGGDHDCLMGDMRPVERSAGVLTLCEVAHKRPIRVD